MWFKVDDGFHKHRKRIRVGVSIEGFAAIGLWTVAGSWSSDEPTGGLIPDDVVDYLAPGFGKELADRLVEAGLWVRVDDGYRFHDWGGWQPTLEEAVAAVRKMSSGGVLGNHRRWHEKAGKTDPRCRYCQEIKNQPPSGTRSGGRSIGFGSGQGVPRSHPDANPIPDSRLLSNEPDKNDQASEQGEHRVPDRGRVGIPESDPNPPYPSRTNISSLSVRESLYDACGHDETTMKKTLELLHTSAVITNEEAYLRKLFNTGDIHRFINQAREHLADKTPRYRGTPHPFNPDIDGVYCNRDGCGLPATHATHRVTTGAAA